MKKQTARQKVLKRYPNAVLDKDGFLPGFGFFDCAVFANKGAMIVRGHGDTPSKAWSDAASKLRG